MWVDAVMMAVVMVVVAVVGVAVVMMIMIMRARAFDKFDASAQIDKRRLVVHTLGQSTLEVDEARRKHSFCLIQRDELLGRRLKCLGTGTRRHQYIDLKIVACNGLNEVFQWLNGDNNITLGLLFSMPTRHKQQSSGHTKYLTKDFVHTLYI